MLLLPIQPRVALHQRGAGPVGIQGQGVEGMVAGRNRCRPDHEAGCEGLGPGAGVAGVAVGIDHQIHPSRHGSAPPGHAAIA